MEFPNLGYLECVFETEDENNQSKYESMVILYNTLFLTMDEAMKIVEDDEFSEHLFVMPKWLFEGVFTDVGVFNGHLLS